LSLPPEILKKVKLLELNTRKLVNNLFAGEYQTVFKGQGMTFADFREYIPGDDIRSIAWPLTAKTGKPYIKKFDEERELTVIIAVDISGSCEFGTGEHLKGEVINFLAALLSFSAAKNKDHVGLLLFSNQVEHFVPPRKGPGQIHRILRDLFYFKSLHKETSIASAMEFLQGVLKKRSTIFVFSDFLDEGFDGALRRIGQKHETVAVVVNDPMEFDIPDIGLVSLEDAETGEIVTVDSSSGQFRKAYRSYRTSQKNKRDDMLLKSRVERIEVDSTSDYVQPLIGFFRQRRSR